MQILIVGAGLSGAVLARELAEAGHQVALHEARGHVAGNCHTRRDPATGVMVHLYGPHIFHTADDEVWDYVRRFARFRDYQHRVRATVGGRVYSLPVNLMTINQFFGTALRPEEARAFIAARTARGDGAPETFEEQALRFVGPELYRAFFEGYTRKQWGCEPAELPASILKRLPLRFDYDDRYFSHPHQAIPEAGYTAMVEAMLDHPAIDVHLSRPATPADAAGYGHVFQTGPLDAWFGHRLGRLGYRTLDFERFSAVDDWQGCAVMNWPDAEVPWTRITEFRHFTPWERPEGSVLYRETSRAAGEGDSLYYPIRLVAEKAMLRDYVELAETGEGVTFVGRLGTYRYLDMDVTIKEALEVARAFLGHLAAGTRMPAFVTRPI